MKEGRKSVTSRTALKKMINSCRLNRILEENLKLQDWKKSNRYGKILSKCKDCISPFKIFKICMIPLKKIITLSAGVFNVGRYGGL